MTHPTTHKRPTGRGCFSWARVPKDGGAVIYRLFRRDQRGTLHWKQVIAPATEPREHIARELNIARHQLRNTVDEIDLEIMGVTQ